MRTHVSFSGGFSKSKSQVAFLLLVLVSGVLALCEAYVSKIYNIVNFMITCLNVNTIGMEYGIIELYEHVK